MGWLSKYFGSTDITVNETTGAIRTHDDTLMDRLVSILSGIITAIFKTETVTKKSVAWLPITSNVAFSPSTGTNGIAIAPKASSSGTTVSGTVWGKPSGSSEAYRIAGTFSFLCSTATLEADGFTDVMKCIDITGMTDIKVIFTGGELAYVPY